VQLVKGATPGRSRSSFVAAGAARSCGFPRVQEEVCGGHPMLNSGAMEEFVIEEEEPWYDQHDLEQGKTETPPCARQHHLRGLAGIQLTEAL